MNTIATKSAEQATLPDPQDALNTLFGNVSSEVFFGKLASADIAPRNQKEASELLDLAGRLRLIEQDPRVQKAASAGNSPFSQMLAELDSTLAANGLDSGIKAASAREHEVAVNQAAYRLMQDPSNYNAVLSVKAAQATALQQRQPA